MFYEFISFALFSQGYRKVARHCRLATPLMTPNEKNHIINIL